LSRLLSGMAGSLGESLGDGSIAANSDGVGH